MRSVHPGRRGEPPLGLILDEQGIHFDASAPSSLETLLAEHPLDDTVLLDRARDGIARLKEGQLSKYNTHLIEHEAPPPGYVLVVDQTRNDASVQYGGATSATFLEALVDAQIENPGARIVIKTHPETTLGLREGHYGKDVETDRISLCEGPVSPLQLLEGAIAVYAVSSLLGFEAILSGHRPKIYGTPFYAGWGLSEDKHVFPRRTRRLSRAQLFAGAMILAPRWVDPCTLRACDFESAVNHLSAQVRSFREDHRGAIGTGMRLWKRNSLQRFYGRFAKLRFLDPPTRAIARAQREQRPVRIWANRATPEIEEQAAQSDVGLNRIEDGFLRSRGLGASLVPPMSLVSDERGIYYDPSRPSEIEHHILRRAELRRDQELRAMELVRSIQRSSITKYNIKGETMVLPKGHRILVPGQVEDDASIRLGCERVATNSALLRETRAANPTAVIIYKPHPDVEAGLRPGTLDEDDRLIADYTAEAADPAELMAQVDEVWTMTSLFGFEALLRGLPVTTLGAPFYSGWGLTKDLGAPPERRRGHRLTLEGLVHATLVDYPRYIDPVTLEPCPPETIIERLQGGQSFQAAPLRLLSKVQGLLSSHSYLWRR